MILFRIINYSCILRGGGDVLGSEFEGLDVVPPFEYIFVGRSGVLSNCHMGGLQERGPAEYIDLKSFQIFSNTFLMASNPSKSFQIDSQK